MKIIGIRYSTGAKLKADVLRAFPNWDGDKQDVPTWLDNHCFAKGRVFDRTYNEDGTIASELFLGWDVYLLVRDEFQIPNWIQGVEIPKEEHQHKFLGIE